MGRASFTHKCSLEYKVLFHELNGSEPNPGSDSKPWASNAFGVEALQTDSLPSSGETLGSPVRMAVPFVKVLLLLGAVCEPRDGALDCFIIKLLIIKLLPYEAAVITL